MEEVKIGRAENRDIPYIKEKLKNYILDADGVDWKEFFVARYKDKTVAFGRIIERGKYLEIASLGVDYYHRRKGIGGKMLSFLAEETKRITHKKPVYCVTHIPGFFRKFGFKKTRSRPEVLEGKKREKCKLDPAGSRIMKLT